MDLKTEPLRKVELGHLLPSTVTPAQEPKIARVPLALLDGTLDIEHAPLTQIKLEFAMLDLIEYPVTSLKDSGSDLDLVTKKLVDILRDARLVVLKQLSQPIPIGSVKEKHVLTITHMVTLPIREGETFYTHTFGVADIPSPPHVIMGRPWLRKYCPAALKIMSEFGQSTSTRPIELEIAQPTTTANTSPAVKPQQKYFSVGGANSLINHLNLHEQHQKDTFDHQNLCLRIRVAVDQALEDQSQDIAVRTTSTKPDPGVRGLTGNQPGWLETIPLPYRQFADTLFSDESASKLPHHRPGQDCTITLKEGETLRQCKLYDMSQEELKQLKALLDLELARGFLQPSDSTSSAPVFFVRDPSNGTRSGQLRLVIDYRDLNSKIKKDDYPIPLTRTVMNDLAGADWLTTIDVRSGFANIRMAPGSEALTAFKTFYGLYEYRVMPMGLATAPAVFQRFINSVLNPHLGVICHAYLDDIVIFTKGSQWEHEKQVAKILKLLSDAGLHLKPHKCKWSRKECNFLGYTAVCGKGIRMSDDKIQAIRDHRPPTSLTELRSFLGLVGFYDKFIPHYSDIVSCLTDLTKKDKPWDFTPTCQRAFQTLLSAVRNDIYLRAFDPEKPIRLSTDASDVAYAGVMEQEYDDGWHPFLIFHHKFKDAEKGWDAPDKELYAIVYAFSHYRHFLSQPAHTVQVLSDHRNLAKFMFSSSLLKSHDGRLGRWWETLSQSNFRIEYRPGQENVLADHFSRYGYPASADLPERQLLPAHRFTTKALADIDQWFKQHATTPNLRKLLETRFANLSDKGPGRRAGSPAPSSTPHVKAKNQNSSPIPVSEPLPRVRVIGDAMTTRQSRLGKSLGIISYSGTSLDHTLPSGAHLRIGQDRRGLGAPFNNQSQQSQTQPRLPIKWVPASESSIG